jgi:hypothetical protein
MGARHLQTGSQCGKEAFVGVAFHHHRFSLYRTKPNGLLRDVFDAFTLLKKAIHFPEGDPFQTFGGIRACASQCHGFWK